MCWKKHNRATTAVQHFQKSHIELQTTNLNTEMNTTCRTLGNDNNKWWSGSPQPTIYCVYRPVKIEGLQQLHLDLCIFNLKTHHALRVRFYMNTCRNPEHTRNV